MKSNMVFLAPLLSGIVVGLFSMIVSILGKLEQFKAEMGSGSSSVAGIPDGLMGMFEVSKMIPPYFIQASVGIYIVQIIFILTSALVIVESGKDVLKEKYELSLNLKRGIYLYLITAIISITALTLLAVVALGGLSIS